MNFKRKFSKKRRFTHVLIFLVISLIIVMAGCSTFKKIKREDPVRDLRQIPKVETYIKVPRPEGRNSYLEDIRNVKAETVLTVKGDSESFSTVISFSKVSDSVQLSGGGKSIPILVDSSDFSGVLKVAKHLQSDIANVSGSSPLLVNKIPSGESVILIAGTLGNSSFIDKLADSGKIDSAELEGKREKFILTTVNNPLPGVDKAVVIAGSDKRGTIYGMYYLSENIGVSPWYFWADVPVKTNSEIFVKQGIFSLGEPKVEYRGIFLNDEDPALGGWAREKFGNLNSKFYAHVFELILRLKGNYLWPAMWGKSLFDDDPKSALLADEYGVIIGTSHHEPMVRAHVEWDRYGKGEWQYDLNKEILSQFWREGIERMGSYESTVTVGMRGDGDEAMSQDTAVPLLQEIIADQRTILEDVIGKSAVDIPQTWVIYKEVQDYWDEGMRVPDDITVVLCDDNWGNIRKLPQLGEDIHEGGYGIYYHFDYVGAPRSYRWMNTTQIERIWEQMNMAYEFGAKKLWIVNVGDLKPMELPISFFLDFAWDPEAIEPSDLPGYTVNWARQQFGSGHAEEIANMLDLYTKYNSRRKPELLRPTGYSRGNYNEAERVLDDYMKLSDEAQALLKDLPAGSLPAYFQLVLYPVQASVNFNEVYIKTGINNLYARQERAAANPLADEVQISYEYDDRDLKKTYHTLLDGKWNHMMDQKKFGYSNWAEPAEESRPVVVRIDLQDEPGMGIAVEGKEESIPLFGNTLELPEFDSVSQRSHFIEIYNTGKGTFSYLIKNTAKWIIIDKPEGEVDLQERIYVSIDWEKAPAGIKTADLKITRPDSEPVIIEVTTENYGNKLDDFTGFLESNGYISIEAANYTGKTESNGISWITIPNLGRTDSAVTTSPAAVEAQKPSGDSPYLEYSIYLKEAGEIKVNLVLSPSLNFHNSDGLKFGISIDDGPVEVINMHATKNWSSSVVNSVTDVSGKLNVPEAGPHVLKYWMIDTGVVLQKIVIDAGELRRAYLGPPQSAFKE